MRIERALKIRDAAVAAIRDVYSAAKIYGSSHESLLDEIHKAQRRTGVDKAPAWVGGYVKGYEKALSDSLYSSGALVFGRMVDGRFISTHRDRPDYYEKLGFSPSAFANLDEATQGHYWSHNLRPFFVAESSRFSAAERAAAEAEGVQL